MKLLKVKINLGSCTGKHAPCCPNQLDIFFQTHQLAEVLGKLVFGSHNTLNTVSSVLVHVMGTQL